MALTDTAIKSAKSSSKPFKLTDEKGLYLLIQPSGGKLWRFDYRFNGKRKTLALGSYPAVSLKDARERHGDARKQLAHDIDPSEARKEKKEAVINAKLKEEKDATCTFEVISMEWFENKRTLWKPTHAEKVLARLKNDMFPFLGKKPITEITSSEVLEALRRIEERDAIDTAHRAKQDVNRVFNYAISTSRAINNPAASLTDALKPKIKGHFASITDPEEIGPLLRKIHGYNGSPVVCSALKIMPYVFVRPGELRTMRWSHIDFEAARWSYASKTGQLHIVPLAEQVIEVLRWLQPITGQTEFVFMGARSDTRPISENTINAALQTLGIDTQTELTGHGFRAMARTVLEEVHGFRPEVTELQLAHAVRDPLGRAYNRTMHLVERRRMMQVWADYLDELRLVKS